MTLVMEDTTNKKQDFVLVGKSEYHDLTTADEKKMEQVWILREDDDGIHTVSINRQFLEVLLRECGDKEKKHETNKSKCAQIKAIQTKATHVCPDCSAELEVSLTMEVDREDTTTRQLLSGNGKEDEGAKNIVHYLKRENKKQRKQMKTLAKDQKRLETHVGKLQEANRATKEAFDALNKFAKKKNVENAQLKKLHRYSKVELEAKEQNWKQQLQESTRETAQLWDVLEKLREKYRVLSRQLREICPTPSFKL